MASTGDNDEAEPQRGYWRWSKQDFLPEESFQSWNNYFSALSQTRLRFKDRLFSRSDDATETEELRKHSEHDMKRCLNWWDLIWFGFGAVIGAGIFVLTGQEAHEHAGSAIVLSYVASGFSAMLSVFCYTEFAVEVPSAGGSFAYLRIELGDFVAFITAANIILDSVIGNAAVARSWTSYFTPKGYGNFQRIKGSQGHAGTVPMSMRQDPMTAAAEQIVVLEKLCKHPEEYLSYDGHCTDSTVKSLSSSLVCTVGEISTWPSAVMCDSELSSQLKSAAYSALKKIEGDIQDDVPTLMSGAGHDAMAISHLTKVRHLWFSLCSCVIEFLVLVILISGNGPKLLCMFFAIVRLNLMTYFIFQFNRYGQRINGKHCTLVLSILLLTLSNFKIINMKILIIYIISINNNPIYTPMALEKKNPSEIISMGISAYWGLRPNGWFGYTVTVPVWFLATLGMSLFLTQQRVPRVWGVPLVPWLPSLSIATNVFLMGSLEYEAFIRFGVCTVIMLIYYFFFGLHATYDMARQQEKLQSKVDQTESIKNAEP
uniref:Cationic amino acid transporter C-terminal domain-containing protein n=1 Tax=Cajanus cajan TaxID=3821 RepID=A0A151QTL1_CAJCA|nr:hypothetical protein KK1_045483 [Cajanus cajan]